MSARGTTALPPPCEPAFQAERFAPRLAELAAIEEGEFRDMFRGSPLSRARYTGFLRNVAIAMGNAGDPRFRPALEKLSASPHSLVAEHARWALTQLKS